MMYILLLLLSYFKGEEVINPQFAIPVAIVLSLAICGSAYISVATVLTLMVPFCTLVGEAPIPPAFDLVGYTAAKYLISVGALCSLFTWYE